MLVLRGQKRVVRCTYVKDDTVKSEGEVWKSSLGETLYGWGRGAVRRKAFTTSLKSRCRYYHAFDMTVRRELERQKLLEH